MADTTEKRLDLYADFIWDLRVPLTEYAKSRGAYAISDPHLELAFQQRILDAIFGLYKEVVKDLLDLADALPELN